MKFNKLFIIGVFLLVILTVGAVSASNDEVSSDESIVLQDSNSSDFGSEKLNLEAIVNDEYLADDEECYIYLHVPRSTVDNISVYVDDVLTDSKVLPYDVEPYAILNFTKMGLEEGKHNITFSYPGNERFTPTNVTYSFNLVNIQIYLPTTDYEDEWGIYVFFSKSTNGTISVFADKKLNKKVTMDYFEDEDRLWISGLDYGVHDIEVRYEGNKGNYSKSGKFSVDYFYPSIGFESEFEWNDIHICIYGPKKLSKNIIVKIAGKSYKVKVKDYEGIITINKKLLKLGKNTIYFSYAGDSKYPKMTKKFTFNVVPRFTSSYEISYGDMESVLVDVPAKTKGTYTLYKVSESDEYDLKYEKIKRGSISNRFVYLPKLSLGEHSFRLVLKVDNKSYTHDFAVFVKKNKASYKASISSKSVKYGKDITVKIISSKLKEKPIILIDGEELKSVNLKKGTVSYSIHKLKPGKYKITVINEYEKKFYSKSFHVTVKKLNPKVTATKMTFKVGEKTKKYKITLKTNKNKVMKNRKITLKVNNKTYSVKTNNNGKAIFKITNLKQKGTFDAVITYGGNDYYNKISKSIKIKVK